ncbi:MAG: alanine racemase [Lachnospiraceae bacterium]|nr:alanine racemase [Lachnospiraceae bacterium]
MIEEVYQKKYYRVSANIDLDALCANVRNTRRLVRPETKLMIIIKADGYGHGAVTIAKAFDELTEHGEPMVAAYGVAVLEEAVELRKAGVTKPILILGVTVSEQVPELVAYDVTQTVFDLELAKQISAEAEKQGKIARVHIKLDTGMGRIGYAGTTEDAKEVLAMTKLPNLQVEGLFSHLATADELDKTFAEEQFEKYQRFEKMLAELGVSFAVRHMGNSAAIMELPQVHMDMVRSGISTYGLYPSEEVDKTKLCLQPALELKSHVTYVKQVEAGFKVGYGSTFVTEKPMRIATVPVGYADGYPRALSNKGRVLIRGKSARILGRVCMDQFMVDVTEIPEAVAGDIVTLVGRDGAEFIPVEEPAELAGSFNYEFVCGIAKRVPRVYYKAGVPVAVRTEFA